MVIFQHDRDPKHRVKNVQRWLEEQIFSVLEWSVQNLDLNPIENLWVFLKEKMQTSYEAAPKLITQL